MKRKLLLLSVMVICIAIAAVGTLAFFNTDAIAHNVITTGGVDIELHEYADAEKTQPFKDLSGVMPGIKVTKIAEVENTGASAAWVRVKLTPAIELADDAADARVGHGDVHGHERVPRTQAAEKRRHRKRRLVADDADGIAPVHAACKGGGDAGGHAPQLVVGDVASPGSTKRDALRVGVRDPLDGVQ